jgi:hypothetical protein
MFRYRNDFELGTSLTSIAFHSKTGKVRYAGKELYEHKITAVYGETIGTFIFYQLSRFRDEVVRWQNMAYI